MAYVYYGRAYDVEKKTIKLVLSWFGNHAVWAVAQAVLAYSKVKNNATGVAKTETVERLNRFIKARFGEG